MAANGNLLEISAIAHQKLTEVMAGQEQEGSLLRVVVSRGAHGGVGYSLGIEQESTDHDLVVEAGGLKLLVEANDAPLVDGAQIDYVDGLMRSGFVISNPNLPAGGQGSCTCGGGGCGCVGGGCGCGGH